MILLFVAANGVYAVTTIGSTVSWPRFAMVFLMLLSFFFRMRLFDEIKDFETDKAVNPTRPLARGILSIPDVKVGLFALMVFELLVAYRLGFWPFLIQICAIFYSLLMFEEFFVGDFLRPHLTSYAVTHTFVSTLLGLSAAIAMTSYDPRGLWHWQYGFFLMNWAFFNLFEFARKTFAASEERKNVDSYSKIFSIPGAVALSGIQAIIGNALLWWALQPSGLSNPPMRMIFPLAALGVYLISIIPFAIKKNAENAKVFRGISSGYLLLQYLIVLLILVWK